MQEDLNNIIALKDFDESFIYPDSTICEDEFSLIDNLESVVSDLFDASAVMENIIDNAPIEHNAELFEFSKKLDIAYMNVKKLVDELMPDYLRSFRGDI